VVEQPEQTVGRLSLLSAGEREQVLYGWNEAGGEYGGPCLPELFEQQVEKTPAAIAVVSEGERLTYRELNERANGVAAYLRAAGVKRESVVGLQLERTAALVVGLLGVLKAGAAYLPLDPGYPEERRQYMLTDAQVELVLTQAGVVELLKQKGVGARGKGSEEPGNLAYVIYTSGSTGRPKGVGVPHAALVNFVAGASEAYGISSRDRVLQFASVSFDTSAEEIYPCLTRGATLVLRSEQMISTAANAESTMMPFEKASRSP